jgi:hypothetical protein
MTSITKLGLQGFAFGVALTSGGCMPQNQDQIDQLRAELTALKTEVASLKGTTPAASTPDATPPVAPGASATPASSAGTAGTAPSTAVSAVGFDWDAAIEKHDKEERDAAWSRLREPDLFTAAKAHIKVYGASLNGVRCKATSCLITINVPKKPKAEYAIMSNPWAGTDMFAHSKGIYSGRTLWSYLLTRHEKDTKEAAADRVNPAELAKKSPEQIHATVLVASTSNTEVKAEGKPTEAAKPAAAKPVAVKPAAAKPAGEAPKAAEPAKPVAEAPKPAGVEVTKPAEAKAVAAKPAAKPAAPTKAATAEAKPVEAKPAGTEAKPVEAKVAVKAVETKPAAETAAVKPEVKAVEAKPAAKAVTKPAADVKTTAKPTEVKPAAAAPAADTKPAAAGATPAPAASAK